MDFKPHVLSQFGIGNEFKNYSKQVCIFLDGLWMDRREFLDSEIKVFVGGCEPENVLNQYYTVEKLIKNHKEFDLILTSNKYVVDKCDNAKFFAFGSSWIKDDFKKIATHFEVSFLCGVKNYLTGHALRHNIFSNIHNVRCKELGLKLNMTVDKKERIFDTSQYSIIIENTKQENYFTEKIVDCFITKTIPIYWGCPNISDFFDNKGIITFDTMDELFKKISMLTPNIYECKLKSIESNYETALKYKNFHGRVDEEIEKLILK
jgi:hypothetical protein